MNRFVPKILLALTCASMSGTLGWFCVLRPGASERTEQFLDDLQIKITDTFKNPNDEVGNGTEVCVRCGEIREVLLRRGGKRDFVPTESSQQSWAEARIGACAEHHWQGVGCWVGRNSVSCYMTANEHMLWKALANLDSAHADQMAHRFAALPAQRQTDLFLGFNHDDGSDKEIARRAAEDAGWSDLAAFWTE